jgi:murein DD-endopeptidase MepM/ murein hydrolase activator NlpD
MQRSETNDRVARQLRYLMAAMLKTRVVGALPLYATAVAFTTSDVVLPPPDCGNAPNQSVTIGEPWRTSPVDISVVGFREPAGAYLHNRGRDLHDGVDLAQRATPAQSGRTPFAVRATGDARVAYAALNGTSTTGYGWTVVLEHSGGKYVVVAHLAMNASKPCVAIDQFLGAGQVIGFIYDPSSAEESSGNTHSPKVTAFDKRQVHIEYIVGAPTGWKGATLGSLKGDRKERLANPEPYLAALGIVFPRTR